MDVNSRICQIKEKIAKAAARVNTNPESIKIIAVTKGVSDKMIMEAYNAGIREFGENKVKELCHKHNLIRGDINWHLLGTLQTNKVKYILDKVTMIHSLDRISLAQELEKKAGVFGNKINALVQVNISGETTKQGIDENDLEWFLSRIAECTGLSVKGLMTIAPLSATKNDLNVRKCFNRLRLLFEKAKTTNYPNVEMSYLSMGMSDDFEIAVEEGSNMVRIGRAIFGETFY